MIVSFVGRKNKEEELSSLRASSVLSSFRNASGKHDRVIALQSSSTMECYKLLLHGLAKSQMKSTARLLNYYTASAKPCLMSRRKAEEGKA